MAHRSYANFPTRVAFQVTSRIDSRTILYQQGAESLLGQGDMLYLPPGQGQPTRVHGAFVSDDEVHRVCAWLKELGPPQYDETVLANPEEAEGEDADAKDAEADALGGESEFGDLLADGDEAMDNGIPAAPRGEKVQRAPMHLRPAAA